MSYSKIHLIGNVGRDAREIASNYGNDGASFSVAWNSRKRIGNEWVDEPPVWYNVTVWGRQAQYVLEHVRKGTKVFVDGKFEPRMYVDQSGQKQMGFNINYAEVVVIDSSFNDGQIPATAPIPAPTPVKPVQPARVVAVPATPAPTPEIRRPRPVSSGKSFNNTAVSPALDIDDAPPPPATPGALTLDNDEDW